MPFKLTKLEAEILAHRLAVPDAIYDALIDSGLAKDEDIDGNRCEVLLASVEKREIPDELSRLDKEILEDCLSGSTWVGCMIGNESDAKIRRHADTGQSLANRLTKQFGLSRIDFPCH